MHKAWELSQGLTNNIDDPESSDTTETSRPPAPPARRRGRPPKRRGSNDDNRKLVKRTRPNNGDEADADSGVTARMRYCLKLADTTRELLRLLPEGFGEPADPGTANALEILIEYIKDLQKLEQREWLPD